MIVHKRSAKGGEVYRAVVEVPIGSDGGGWSVENFRALLGTAEVRCACKSLAFFEFSSFLSGVREDGDSVRVN